MTIPSRRVAGSMTPYASFVSGANQVAKNKVKKNMTNEIQEPQQLSPKAKEAEPGAVAGGLGLMGLL